MFGEGSTHSFTLQQLEVFLNLKKLQLHSGVKGSKNCQVLCPVSAAGARNTLITPLLEAVKALEIHTVTLQPGWLMTDTDCPKRLWSLICWRNSVHDWTWSCAASCSWPCVSRSWTSHSLEVPSDLSPLDFTQSGLLHPGIGNRTWVLWSGAAIQQPGSVVRSCRPRTEIQQVST